MGEGQGAPSAGGGHNLFPYEREIRGLIGLALSAGAAGYAALGVQDTAGWAVVAALAVMAIYITRTAIHQHCALYAALRINADAERRNRYMALLPAYNPAPVLAFDDQGEAQFRNKPAEGRFGAIERLTDILGSSAPDPRAVVELGERFHETLDIQDRSYQLCGQGVPSARTLLLYGFDITQVVSLQREMIATQEDIINRMGEIGETRSEEVGNHVRRVALYCRILAELSGLDSDAARTLELASPMHDIGKVAIPDRILGKPGRLDDEEWALMKQHTSIGHDLLCRSGRPILQTAATVAHQHHERWDGGGYPQGLAGTDIHIYGRITALADVFDALGSDRVYKSAWSLDAILDLLRRERGYHFDPALVDAFLGDLDRFLAVRDQYTDPVD